MSEREARLGLSAVTEPGDPHVAADVKRLGVEEVWSRLSGAASDTSSPAELRARDFQAGRVLEHAAHVGARFVIPGDPEWPAQLDDLGGRAHINEQTGVPLGLWITGGGDLAELAAAAVTMVGSRACTAYGETVATELASGLSDAGRTVISGGAYGIDAAAHRGALAGRTPTIVVLASGVDQPYPPAHSALFARVADQGLIVSELAPGEHPTRTRFLARNRLLAALSGGTVIVEAAVRSGARHTIAWADALQRVVMAVPGPVTSALSYTPNRLTGEGQARLVTRAGDVIDHLAADALAPLASPMPTGQVWEHVPSHAPGRHPGPQAPSVSQTTAIGF